MKKRKDGQAERRLNRLASKLHLRVVLSREHDGECRVSLECGGFGETKEVYVLHSAISQLALAKGRGREQAIQKFIAFLSGGRLSWCHPVWGNKQADVPRWR